MNKLICQHNMKMSNGCRNSDDECKYPTFQYIFASTLFSLDNRGQPQRISLLSEIKHIGRGQRGVEPQRVQQHLTADGSDFSVQQRQCRQRGVEFDSAGEELCTVVAYWIVVELQCSESVSKNKKIT